MPHLFFATNRIPADPVDGIASPDHSWHNFVCRNLPEIFSQRSFEWVASGTR